jgi:hypothetical protein
LRKKGKNRKTKTCFGNYNFKLPLIVLSLGFTVVFVISFLIQFYLLFIVATVLIIEKQS